jgi:poly-beta-hydroxyalkanoate depolymerase
LQEKVYDLVSMIDYIMQLLDEIGEEADSSVVDEISPPLA